MFQGISYRSPHLVLITSLVDQAGFILLISEDGGLGLSGVVGKNGCRYLIHFSDPSVSSVQWLSHVLLFATPWTAARQASLLITDSWSLPKLMSFESVMPSNHLILCCPLLLLPSIFPSIRSFQMSQFFASDSQSIGVSPSASVLPMNIQDWFP